MTAIEGPRISYNLATKGSAACWRVGHPPVTAPVHDRLPTPRGSSAPAEAGEPRIPAWLPAAAARWRASLAPRVGRPINTRASCRRQAFPVFAIPSGTACPKNEQKALPPPSLTLFSLLPCSSRGEAAARHLSPMPASFFLRATCVSRLSSRVLCSAPVPRLLLAGEGKGCSCGVVAQLLPVLQALLGRC